MSCNVASYVAEAEENGWDLLGSSKSSNQEEDERGKRKLHSCDEKNLLSEGRLIL